MSKRFALVMAVAAVGFIVAIPTAAAGGGCHASYGLEMSSESTTQAAIGKCAFLPTVTYIDAGDEVTWTNKDPVPHTVSGANYSWGTERMLEQNDSVSYTFKKDGVYPYYCLLHPGMVGAVVVGDATQPAAMINGSADIEETSTLNAATASETVQEDLEPAATNVGLIATLIVALLLIGAVFVTRGALAKRRAVTG
jgi:plastocyanin